jgi:NAD(P)-dependent dehydrogenase (short-subunit alcohol dehydrogenase family)
MAHQRKVVVVGAGSGIGAAVATHLHDRGDFVLAVDVREHQTPASQYALCDLRDANSIRELLDQIGAGWDMLAHVAGVPGTAPAADVLKVNYLGMRLMTDGMLPLLRQGGSVVAVASTAALGWDQRLDILAGLLELTDANAVEKWQAVQDPNYPVYSTSKQAVILYAKRLAGPAWTKYGVRINARDPSKRRSCPTSSRPWARTFWTCAAPPSVGTPPWTTSCLPSSSSVHQRPGGSTVRTSTSTADSSTR